MFVVVTGPVVLSLPRSLVVCFTMLSESSSTHASRSQIHSNKRRMQWSGAPACGESDCPFDFDSHYAWLSYFPSVPYTISRVRHRSVGSGDLRARVPDKCRPCQPGTRAARHGRYGVEHQAESGPARASHSQCVSTRMNHRQCVRAAPLAQENHARHEGGGNMNPVVRMMER